MAAVESEYDWGVDTFDPRTIDQSWMLNSGGKKVLALIAKMSGQRVFHCEHKSFGRTVTRIIMKTPGQRPCIATVSYSEQHDMVVYLRSKGFVLAEIPFWECYMFV